MYQDKRFAERDSQISLENTEDTDTARDTLQAITTVLSHRIDLSCLEAL